MNSMLPRSLSRTKTSPIDVPRTNRVVNIQGLTTMPPGKMVPVYAFPILREDQMTRCTVQATVEMHETVEILANNVNVVMKAYLVPWLALERFDGLDDFNRSYQKEPRIDGGPVVPFVETAVAEAYGVNLVHKYLGLHAKPGSNYNTMYVEAYNAIWNFRAKNRSPGIAARARLLNSALAPAFWQHDRFAHIVPEFDQATLDGAVALNVTNARMPVKGIGISPAASTLTNQTNRETGAVANGTFPHAVATAASTYLRVTAPSGTDMFPDVFAELQANGITISLSNIELAKKTQAFAALRKQYVGHDDDYIIDMLMGGLTVPDLAWQQPILLAEDRTIMGMSKRYASNGADLTKSVVNGATQIQMNMRLPRCPTGGVVMLVCEVTPDSLFEREADSLLHTLDVEQFPEFLRDYLDPEKVQIVKNGRIDVDHATPNDVFGYEPTNAQWAHQGPRIGGRFYKPQASSGFNQDRQRFWANETINPKLSEDFYLTTTLNQLPFVQSILDNFEIMIEGAAAINGNTQFGPLLIEGSSDDYAAVLAEAPQDRLVQP